MTAPASYRPARTAAARPVRTAGTGSAAGPAPADSSGLPRYPVRRAPRSEPADEDEVRHLRVVPPQGEELPFEDGPPAPRRGTSDTLSTQPPPGRRLPDPEAWSWVFVQAVLEILVGRRPPAQLRAWTNPAVFSGLTKAVGHRKWASVAGARPGIRSLRVSEPADGIVEVCVVLSRNGRCAALAARLEGVDGRWRCVALQIG